MLSLSKHLRWHLSPVREEHALLPEIGSNGVIGCFDRLNMTIQGGSLATSNIEPAHSLAYARCQSP